MKKILLAATLALGMGAMSANAQTVQESKFMDNWSFTLKGGAVSPFQGHGFWKNARGMWGAEIRKMVTPVFGIGVEGELSVNTSSWTALKSPNTFDHMYVGVFGTVNFNNLFAGYAGAPRLFEVEAVAGTGWLHSYYPTVITEDGNSWATKLGLNFNFNLGEAKAWTIGIKPAIIFNMNAADIPLTNMGYSAQFNSNHAYVEMEAGVTYHFGNSNGTHSFVIAELRDDAQIAALNAEINDLRAQLAACDSNNSALQANIAALEQKIKALEARKPEYKEVVKNLDNIRWIFFRLSSSTIEPLQKPNIEMAAKAAKDNANSTVVVKGYASKDGSKAFNDKLAQRRADSVKKALINAGVPANRIEAQGCGIGDLFEQNSWNRCAKIEVK